MRIYPRPPIEADDVLTEIEYTLGSWERSRFADSDDVIRRQDVPNIGNALILSSGGRQFAIVVYEVSS